MGERPIRKVGFEVDVLVLADVFFFQWYGLCDW